MATARTARAKAEPPHPLAHLIPDPEISSEYVSRVIHGVKDLNLLAYAQDTQQNVMLYGDTGPGKTAMVMAYAAATKQPLVTVNCNGGIDPNSFWGSYIFDESTGGVKYVYSDVTQVIRHGGIFYLDEPNYMPPKTGAVFHSLLDRRRFVSILERGNELIHAHKRLFVVGSFNPNYQGTRKMNEAFMNRFKIMLEIDYSPEVEGELVSMSVVLEIAAKLRAARAEGALSTPTSTNMLMDFEQHALDLELPFAIDNFVAHYGASERLAVKEVFNLHMTELENQYAELVELVGEQEDDD